MSRILPALVVTAFVCSIALGSIAMAEGPMKIAGPVSFPSKVKAGEKFTLTVPVDGNLAGIEEEVLIDFLSYKHDAPPGVSKGRSEQHFATQYDYKGKLDPAAKTVKADLVFKDAGHRNGSFRIKYKISGAAYETESHSVGAMFIE